MQGVLEDALATVLRCPVALTVAGRTDAGVHAEGQVAHVDLAEPLPDADQLLRRMARFLPADVRIRAIAPAAAGFDARFSAIRRHYAYRLTTAAYGAEPLAARSVVAWKPGLDLAVMRAASHSLLGLHDFAAFCRRRDGATTVRELQRFDWTASGELLTAHVSADAFCWSMVRSLVGAVLAVGAGRRAAEWPASLLTERERSSAVLVAPAHGLSLVRVDYPPDDQLAARATETRALRSAPATDSCCGE